MVQIMNIKKLCCHLVLLVTIFVTMTFAQVHESVEKNPLSSKDSLQFDSFTGRMYEVIQKEMFDSKTGIIIFVNDTIWVDKSENSLKKLYFDPVTGLPVEVQSKTTISMNMFNKSHNALWADGKLISRVRLTAKKEHKSLPWMMIGGPASCGTMILTSVAGAYIAAGPGFLIGSIAGAVLPPFVFSEISGKPKILYPEDLPQSQREIYKKLYTKEIKRNRRNSVFKGELAGCGVFIFVVALLAEFY